MGFLKYQFKQWYGPLESKLAVSWYKETESLDMSQPTALPNFKPD